VSSSVLIPYGMGGFYRAYMGFNKLTLLALLGAFSAEFAHDGKATNVLCFDFTFLTLRTYAINEEMRMRGYETWDGRKMYMNQMEMESRTVNTIFGFQCDYLMY
jgi:hypothetical protein